jgi:stearoyl-CoA desaturase (delta-9 desaturase)
MKSDQVQWGNILFILGYHLFLAIALPIYFFQHAPSGALIGISIALVFISGLAVTAGYHRLYSHLTYKASPIVEPFLLFFASVATQGSALQWCHDHRLHHAFIDTEKDPYSIKKGFWHAHILWMFHKTRDIDPKVVSDLLRSKLLVFQHKYYALCMIASNLIVFLAVGWLLNDYWGAFLFAWWGRLFALHHTTWCINSLAHTWGTHHYSREHSAVDNYFISLLTYGEGYHNYHHTFSQDYRNGIRWYHFDPTKWLIWFLSKVGLARDLKKVNDFRITKQLISQHKERLTENLKNAFQLDLEKQVSAMADRLIGHLNTLQTLYEKYKAIPRDQIRQAKKEWKEDWKRWKELIRAAHRVVEITH